MTTVQINGVTIEIPRLVKKPGEYKAVSTEQELRDALADGWRLRLHEPAADPPQDAVTQGRSAVDRVAHTHEAAGSNPAPAPHAEPFPDVLDDPDGTVSDEPAAEADAEAPTKRKRGRPRKG